MTEDDDFLQEICLNLLFLIMLKLSKFSFSTPIFTHSLHFCTEALS